MEHKGMKFYNTSGVESDCLQLMKDLRLNALRLRVWFNHKEFNNWCSTADLVTKAKRAAELGMNVLVDFHYSDWWPDPRQQHKPAAWKGLNLADLKKAIADHTACLLYTSHFCRLRSRVACHDDCRLDDERCVFLLSQPAE